MMFISKAYLLIYNAVQTFAWSVVLVQVLTAVLFKDAASVYKDAGVTVRKSHDAL